MTKTTKKKKKLSKMNDQELAGVTDKLEADARDRSRWYETEASKRHGPARETWLEENTTAISIRMPNPLLRVLKACAEREGIVYQTLVKRWLHERVQQIASERRTTRGELAGHLRQEHEKNEQELLELVRRR
jgi:predicted DNA binding CopG/RHH family protein